MKRRGLLTAVSSIALLAMSPAEKLVILGGSNSPTLDLNFAAGNFDSRISFTRASNAWAYDATGTLKQFGNNAPRLDYGPTPGGVTNWLLYSETLSNWNLSGCTVTSAAVSPPSGINAVWHIANTATSAAHNIGSPSGTVYNKNTTYTFSGYFKTAEYPVVQMNINGPVAQTSVDFNLNAGTTLVTSSTTGYVSNSILALGGGWYRCSVTFTSQTTQTTGSGVFILPLPDTTGGNFPTTIGDGVSGIYATGMQQEIASTAGNYVPTVGVPVNSGATPLGFLVEEVRTNSISNNTMVGAIAGVSTGPGALPTNWVQGTLTAQTVTIIGTGTELGVSYIDLKIDSSGAGGSRVQFDAPAWATSTAFSGSLYARMVSGSLSGFATFVFRTLSTPSNAVTSTDMMTISTNPIPTQRFTHVGTSGGSDTGLRPEIAWTTTGAGSVTLRIGLPQLELGAFVTSPILTTGSIVPRNADFSSMLVSGLLNPLVSSVVIEGMIPSAVSAISGLLVIDDGTAANRITLRLLVVTLNAAYVVSSAATAQINTSTNVTNGIPFKFGAILQPNILTVSANGNTPTSASGASPSGLTFLHLGQNSPGVSYLNGYLRRIRIGPGKSLFQS